MGRRRGTVMVGGHNWWLSASLTMFCRYCFAAGDLWVQSLPMEAGLGRCGWALHRWLPPPPPLLDARVAGEGDMPTDSASGLPGGAAEDDRK